MNVNIKGEFRLHLGGLIDIIKGTKDTLKMGDNDLSAIKNYLEQIMQQIKKGEIIAFDNHPTAYKIIDYLYNTGTKISVISYSTDIIKYVAKYTDFNIILPNGVVNGTYHIIVGPDVVQTFSKYQIRYYFAAVPYMIEDALYQSIPEVAELQLTLYNNANDTLVVNRPEFLSTESLRGYMFIGYF